MTAIRQLKDRGISIKFEKDYIDKLLWKSVLDGGAITAEGLDEPCIVACYSIDPRSKGAVLNVRRTLELAGKTRSDGELY